jgi:two-component system nitrogen regulation sensor histidine kinase GlnL
LSAATDAAEKGQPFGEIEGELEPAALLERLSTAVVCVDDGLCVRHANPSAQELLGLARGGRGEIARPLLPLAEDFRRLLRRWEMRTYREHRIEVSGRTLTVDCVVAPCAANLLLVELTPLDRHLLISGEEALNERHQAARLLVRTLAHEVRNPLAGVRGAAQLLARRCTEDTEDRACTEVILQEVDRLSRLVDRLLGPRRPSERRTINIHEPLEHVRRLTENERLPGLRLLRDYDPSLPLILADPEQIVQALLNLVRNAREAMAERGTILLRTRIERQYTIQGRRHPLVVRADVVDDGPGVPEALREKLFLPLVSGSGRGTGLGLAIAQDLVQRHGGLLEWRSRPGETVFSILLPVAEDDA